MPEKNGHALAPIAARSRKSGRNMRRIESKDNPLIRRLSRLAGERKFRRTQGEMVCEGEKLLREALSSGIPVTEVVLGETRQLDTGLLEQAERQGARLTEVPESLLARLSNVETPQGLAFVCRQPTVSLERLEQAQRVLVLDGLQDPGNLGTILRTADAFALDGIILCEGCVDPVSPKVVRATMGAIFRIPIAMATLEQTAAWLEARRIPLYATALSQSSVPLTQVCLDRAAVLIGNEGRGVSERGLQLSQKQLIIPMAGRAESLNASIAAAIVMYEMSRSGQGTAEGKGERG